MDSISGPGLAKASRSSLMLISLFHSLKSRPSVGLDKSSIVLLVLLVLAATCPQLVANQAINRDRRLPTSAGVSSSPNLTCNVWNSRLIHSLAFTNLRPPSNLANANASFAGQTVVENKHDFDKECSLLSKSLFSNARVKDEPARLVTFSQPLTSQLLNPRVQASNGGGGAKETDYLVVNILDFTITYSNTIHINLANYKRLVANQAFRNYKSTQSSRSANGGGGGIRLVFNLVTRSFITFRILNLPNDNTYFSEIVFLLHGDCSLDLFEKTSAAGPSNSTTNPSSASGSRPTITVLHSPYYDLLPQTPVSSASAGGAASPPQSPRPAAASASTTPQLNPNRASWFSYLLSTFYSSPLKSFTVVYVERLFKFCAINHVKIDLEKLVMSSIKFITDKKAAADQTYEQNLIQVSEKLTDPDKLMNKCTYSPPPPPLPVEYKKDLGQHQAMYGLKEPSDQNVSSYLINATASGESTLSDNAWNRNVVAHHHATSSGFNQIYFFDVESAINDEPSSPGSEDDEMSSNDLRVYIRECDLNKQYLLIFYSNYSNDALSKKIFLDDSNCPITIKSNVMIYDTLNEPHPWVEQYSLDDQVNLVTLNTKDEFIKAQIAAKLAINWFFYSKISSNVNEIEISFITDTSRSSTAPHKFFNRIQQRVFYERDLYRPLDEKVQNLTITDVQRNLKDQFSVKFTVLEADVLEYFTNRYLNLYQYLKDETHQNDPVSFKKQFLSKKQFELNYRYFFVTNKKCRVVYLNNEVTRYPNQLLLIFNSNLYDNMFERDATNSEGLPAKCFYLDKASQTLYLTLAFNLNELSYTQTVYFTVKHQLNQKIDFHVMAQKEEAINSYYDQTILMNKESTYKVNGTLAVSSVPSATKNVDAELSVKMTSMDSSVDWHIDTCWITENQCEEDELSQLLPHQMPAEPQNHIQASGTDEYLTDHDYAGPDYENEGNQQDYEPSSIDNGDNNNSKDHGDSEAAKDPANEFISKPEHDELKFNVTRYSSMVKLTSVNFYEQTIEYSLTFMSLNETHDQKILACSLKPCAHCKCSSNPRFQCDKNSKLVKYLTDKKPMPTKTIKLTRLNFDELNKTRRLVISVDSENMLVDLKCVNSSQKDGNNNNNKSIFKVSSITNGISSFKEFVDRHKIPLILLILLIISIIITLIVLRFFLQKYFLCSKCIFKANSTSRCRHRRHHHQNHVNASFRSGSSKNSVFRFSSEAPDVVNGGNEDESKLNLLVANTNGRGGGNNLTSHQPNSNNGKQQFVKTTSEL